MRYIQFVIVYRNHKRRTFLIKSPDRINSDVIRKAMDNCRAIIGGRRTKAIFVRHVITNGPTPVERAICKYDNMDDINPMSVTGVNMALAALRRIK